MAALIGVGGYVHLCLYRRGYRTIPKIGVGFLLQVIASAALTILLLAGPRLLARATRLSEGVAVIALQAAVLALAAGTLVAFAWTRTPSGLFNFREQGLQPAPQAVIALIAETAAVILAGGELLAESMRFHRFRAHVRQV